jgi:hypothetical protein
VQLKPLLNGGSSYRPSEAIGLQRLIWSKSGKLQPGTDVLSGFLPEWHHTLLLGSAQIDVKISFKGRQPNKESAAKPTLPLRFPGHGPA